LLQVNNSPFSQQQIELLNALLPTLTEGQRQWLCGYLNGLGAAGAVLAAGPYASPGLWAGTAAGGIAGAGPVMAPGPAGLLPAADAAGQAAAAVASAQSPAVPSPVAASPAPPSFAEPKEATVLFGSQTGNSQRLAGQLAKRLEDAGWRVTLSSMRDYKTNQLKNARNLFIVVSTHGEGDPPDNAASFHEFLHGKRAPHLENTRFAVLALGDSSYEKFCQTGKDFDKRLEELGARRLVPRVDCDVDFDEPAAKWMDSVLEALNRLQEQGTEEAREPASSPSAQPATPAANGSPAAFAASGPVAGAAVRLPGYAAHAGALGLAGHAGVAAAGQAGFAGYAGVAGYTGLAGHAGFANGAAGGTAVLAPPAPAAAATAAPEKPAWSRSNPFPAEVVDNINLNGRGSDRETRHLVLSLEDSGLVYEPGDAVAMFPENDPKLVDAVIEAAGWLPDVQVPAGQQGTLPLRDALLRHYEITVLTRPLVAGIAELAGSGKLKELAAEGNEAAFRAYAAGRDLLDLLRDYGLKGLPAADVVRLLRKIPPRQYSIASSQLVHPDEVFLTIRKVEYEAHGRRRTGVCSGHVAERLAPGDRVPIYIHHNPNFKLPADPDTPIIMIGPGTGVAPFRAFVEEREETGAKGKSWLFFGDRRFRTDFLYQTDWQRWLKSGALTRMDVAFSRDTPSKVYVQHRMLEKSRDLYAWIEEGAVLYVCGDEKNMARDVEDALVSVIAKESGKSRAEAAAVLAELKAQNRYRRDVY